jgi:hypothetical protein
MRKGKEEVEKMGTPSVLTFLKKSIATPGGMQAPMGEGDLSKVCEENRNEHEANLKINRVCRGAS